MAPLPDRSAAMAHCLRKTIGCIVFVFCLNVATAQTISQAEYFFDTDPGVGNGTAIAITSGDPVTFTETINTAGLSPGYHILFVRTRASDGKWSLYEPRDFLIEQAITAAEYFFDVDPGVGNGIPLSITPGQTSFTSTISTASLSDGEHSLFIRTRHENDNWSLSDPRSFYIQTRIVRAEYFINVDPGLGNGIPLPVTTPSDLITINTTISTTPLANGDHFLFVRTQDIHGNWSFYEPQLFQVDDALPVELTDFKATRFGTGKVKLSWTTHTEINNDFFTLEHSADGKEFAVIAKVRGAGTSLTPIQYEEIHREPAPGVNYYRLKQTDFDGKFKYSSIISVDVSSNEGAIVYPNPIRTEWFIDFSKTEDYEHVIEILDITGRKLIDLKTNGNNLIQLNRMHLSSGNYILRITSDKGNSIFKKLIFE